MPTLNYTKVNDFVEDLASKVHDLGSDDLKIALSNTAPASETNDPTADGNGVLANVTQIAYTNLLTYDDGDGTKTDTARSITVGTPTLTSGTYALPLTDLRVEASGGALPTFRYIYVYNDTATNDELVSVFDYGSAVDLADGDNVLLDFSNLFTLS